MFVLRSGVQLCQEGPREWATDKSHLKGNRCKVVIGVIGGE